MDGTLLLAGGACLLSSLGALEAFMHRRSLSRIPIRIHVNGTRGKSSVTRLIAAGLRAGGLRTCAKTTGTLPRMIMPDGGEYAVFRPGRANINEQLRVVRLAAQLRADALVLECMALQPSLQSLCELKIARATHGVITNARADHLDVMGPRVRDVAWALAGSTPVKARLYTAEQRLLDVFAAAAADRQTELRAVDEHEVAAVQPGDLAGFQYIEHAENVALALRVCRDLGVARQTALGGMWEGASDPGAMSLYQLSDQAQRMVFVNGFAANDPESTGQIWNMLADRFWEIQRRIALINCRADRADRSRQLAEACCTWKSADHYMVIGTGTEVFARRAVEAGLSADRITCWEQIRTERLFEEISSRAQGSALVVGMGNISGPGLGLVEYVQQRCRKPAQSVYEQREAA